MARANLGSPTAIVQPCDLSDLLDWLRREVTDSVADLAIRRVVLDVATSLDSFIRWAPTAVLLWEGAVRTKGSEKHQYPAALKEALRSRSVSANALSNGPAVTAYQYAGGHRPPRVGSNNGWSIHHIYSGKFPYAGRGGSLHAVNRGLHFTQSAGLVAVHPIADQMCDEFPSFAWLLRAQSYLQFRYDPDGVFDAAIHDEYGFVKRPPTIAFRRAMADVRA